MRLLLREHLAEILQTLRNVRRAQPVEPFDETASIYSANPIKPSPFLVCF